MAKQATTRINIEVTEADIERAHASDSYNCVVSQAVARSVPDARNIDTDIQTIRFTRASGERWVYLTPYAVQGYIVAFDAGDTIEPFSFQLRDPRRTRRVVKTEAGKAIDRAGQMVRRKKKKVAVAVNEPSVTATTSGVVASVEQAEAQLEDVKSAYKKAVQTRSDGAGPRVPTVHKRKTRAYGHRLLRINQD